MVGTEWVVVYTSVQTVRIVRIESKLTVQTILSLILPPSFMSASLNIALVTRGAAYYSERLAELRASGLSLTRSHATIQYEVLCISEYLQACKAVAAPLPSPCTCTAERISIACVMGPDHNQAL